MSNNMNVTTNTVSQENQRQAVVKAKNVEQTVSQPQTVETTEEPKTQQASIDALEKISTQMSDMMSMMKKNLVFRVDTKSGQSVVSVLDEKSGDLIRQIPSAEALDLAKKMSDVTGLIMETKA